MLLFFVSDYAEKQPPCRLPGLTAGEKITVKDAILGMIIKSCNGCSVVVAEHLTGSVPNFVNRMNATAKKLNLRNTNFTNPSGWHNPKQKTTAWDMVKLGCILYRTFPEYRHFFKVKKMIYKNNLVHTHNRIGNLYPGAIGIKTGYHVPSGFNLTAFCSGKRKGKPHELMSVMIGEDVARIRDLKTCTLFRNFYKSR